MPGTLMARLNVRGSELYPELAKKLHFDYENNGSLVIAFDEQGRTLLNTLLERGKKNGKRRPHMSGDTREIVFQKYSSFPSMQLYFILT